MKKEKSSMIYKQLRFLFGFGFLFLAQSFSTNGQINEDFLRHLVKEDLKNEHLTYLNSIELPEDSLNYFLAKYYFLYFNEDAFLSHFNLGDDVCRNDSVFIKKATTKFLGMPGEFRENWFATEVPKHASLSIYESIYQFSKQKRGVLTTEIPLDIEKSYAQFLKIRKKSPFLAATLSTVLPGSGKLYIGNVRTGFYTMFSMALLGFQTWESYRSKGVEHVLTITNAGFFSGYYFANIVGSYRTTKQKKEEFKNQFLIDASTYYTSLIIEPLY
jgi:hypothetical protein